MKKLKTNKASKNFGTVIDNIIYFMSSVSERKEKGGGAEKVFEEIITKKDKQKFKN